MSEGGRTLCIASPNPDTFINHEQRQEIAQMQLRQKIHIESLQEIHIPHGIGYMVNGYRVVTTAEIKQTPEIINRRT